MPRTGSSRRAKSADRVTYLPPKEQSTSRPSSAPSLQQVLRAGGEAPEAARPQAWAVGLNRVTLSFSNGALDVEWRRLVANRTRALWMRSLLSAVVYQALRHAADLAEFGGSTTSTIVCRLCLACFQLTIYCLAYFDLVAPSQWAIALNAFSYGVVELLLLVRSLSPRVKPGDWLQICYGLAWFVVPKMSALQFFPACVGSLGIVAWWTFLSCVTTLPSSGDFLADVADVAARLAMPWRESRRRAARAAACAGVHCAREALRALERGGDAGSSARTSWADLTAGMALVIPVVFLFNVVAYSSEKSVKERFVLRSALAHEHNHDVRLSLLSEDVSSMVARISAVVTRSTNDDERTYAHSQERLLLASLPCFLLALLGWFPSAQRLFGDLVASSFGGAAGAWAALTHVAGLTLFLLVLTRRVTFLILTPLVFASVLYLTAQLFGPGYAAPVFRGFGSTVVLVAFAVALGFSYRGMRLFAALLAFARKTLFLHPELQEDLGTGAEKEVLSRLVSAVDLPRPPSAGAVKEALGPETPPAPDRALDPGQPNDWSLCSLPSDDALSSRTNSETALSASEPRPKRLPVLALGATEMSCSFCSHDKAGDCLATHAVPVCSSWARWYLSTAERLAVRDRRRSELGERPPSPATLEPGPRPCCDFAALALERVALHRENAQLKAQVARLQRGAVSG